jgi:Gpi18-like mannosyltransferase
MNAVDPFSGGIAMADVGSRSSRFPLLPLLAIGTVALAVRLALLRYTNLDLADHFVPWLDRMRTQGFWHAIAHPFSKYGYTPFYSYAIRLADSILPSGTDPKIVIKSVSIVFDFVAASLAFALVRLRWSDSRYSLAAFAAILLAPTILLNGAYWGQSDIVYTAFLLACLYALLVRSPIWATVWFGVALAVKAQAMWLGPFILMMVLRGRIRWWLLGSVPAVYFLLAVPALLAGRSLFEVATVYATQASTQSMLTYSAANLLFFPHYFFMHLGWWPESIPVIARLGMAFTAILGLAFAWKAARGNLGPEALLLAALVSVLIAPQFLPYMHNRYFFSADVITITLALWRPSVYWPAALLMQASSFVTYISFLWGAQLMAEPVPGWLAVVGFSNNLQPVTGLEALAGIANFLLLLWCGRRLLRLLNNPALQA